MTRLPIILCFTLGLHLGAFGVIDSVVFAQSEISIVDDRSIYVPDEYEVEEGDSLWLISQEFFNDPWLWPNLWALNPQITNPHWIYPGDIVRLKWNPKISQQNQRDDFNLESVGYSADLQKVARLVVNKGMIIEGATNHMGIIFASPEPKTYLAEGDRVYLKVDDPSKIQLSQRLSLYRLTSSVIHPDTKESVGQKVLLVGSVEVLEKGDQDQMIKARIVKAHQEIERGDLVVEDISNLIEVNPVKNLVDLEGVILDSLEDFSELGQHHVVFLNLGVEDGVQVGNRLSVIRRGDGIEKFSRNEDDAMPIEPIGEVLIISTQPHTATALITRSMLELRRGDQVLMLRNY
jgi:hypothetical protein